jgi:hypothetical protein
MSSFFLYCIAMKKHNVAVINKELTKEKKLAKEQGNKKSRMMLPSSGFF